jgi:catechol 2,3-dioxygenase-like lactoylglutathione lyase family enzyme
MVRLFRDVMGLAVEFEEPTTTELSLPSGDRVQVFAPEDPYFEFFGEQTSGPVALFEVDDVDAAHAELAAAGIEIVGGTERDSNWEWLHFRAPDGRLYELASRRLNADSWS